MKPQTLFSGPSISSVLPLFSNGPEETIKDTFNPLSCFFNSFQDAIHWRNSLDDNQIEYLNKIDKYIANLVPGEQTEISKIVKPENMELFFNCLSYVILGADIFDSISFNSTFLIFKLNNPTLK